MADHNPTEPEPVLERPAPIETKLPPQGQSSMSAILNGIGNGAMIGGAPLAITAAIKGWKKEPVSPKLNQFNIALTVAGVAVGAVYGLYEAKHMTEYRTAIRDNIVDLRQRLDAHEQQLGIKR